MDLKHFLRSVELFEGLTEAELEAVASICKERRLKRGEAIAVQGDPGDELFIVTEGFLEVVLEAPGRVVVNLGEGQIIGEMALVDQGPRSATVKAVDDPTIVQVISREDFETLCQLNSRIGYSVMRNIAADLSFKLRHRNISEQ